MKIKRALSFALATLVVMALLPLGGLSAFAAEGQDGTLGATDEVLDTTEATASEEATEATDLDTEMTVSEAVATTAATSDEGATEQPGAGGATDGFTVAAPAPANVVFTAQNTVYLQSPTDLLFKADDPAQLVGYDFEAVRFMNVTLASDYGAWLDTNEGVTYDPATGTLTIPAAAFGQHNTSGPSNLTPGTYRAHIVLTDGASNYEDYYADFTLGDTPPSTIYPVLEHFDDHVGDGRVIDARVDADDSKFVGLYLNGTLVAPSNYTITPGSTVITLTPAHLSTYANGTYWFTAEYSDGTSEPIRLYVNVQSGGSGSGGTGTGTGGSSMPATGDTGGVLYLGIALLGVALGGGCLVISRKRKSL